MRPGVTEVMPHPPSPVFDDEHFTTWYDPVPCVLHPERVTEYPAYGDLPGGLREQVEEWDRVRDAGEDVPRPYWSSLSTAPGAKALGYPRWIQEPRWPLCADCGERMTHLVTLSTVEFEQGRWYPDDEPSSSFARNYAPHGLYIGRLGDMYVFICTTCPHLPLGTNIQGT